MYTTPLYCIKKSATTAQRPFHTEVADENHSIKNGNDYINVYTKMDDVLTLNLTETKIISPKAKNKFYRSIFMRLAAVAIASVTSLT